MSGSENISDGTSQDVEAQGARLSASCCGLRKGKIPRSASHVSESTASKDYCVENESRWSLRSVRWGQIIRRQDHAGLILLVIFYVATGILHWTVDPRVNDFYIYDATISYPPANKRGFEATVPAWAAIFIPLLMGIATLVLGELFYSRYEHHSLTDALSVMLFFLLDDAQAVGLTLMTVMATKISVGRYRPDFLARCDPADPWLPPGGPVLEYGNNTIGMYPCSDTYSEDTIKDGRQSFPSGHAAFSMVLGAYGAGYMIWCWNLRVAWGPRTKSPWAEFFNDLLNVAAKIWTICLLGFSWGVGCTRIIDYQHNVSDVVAGWVLGLSVAAIYLLRSTPRYKKVLTYIPCKVREQVVSPEEDSSE
jgi:membrane-associated phospholipid phosphatase